MLLILMDVAPFGFCAMAWVVFTQGPSVRLFCQPLSGSPSPCRVKAKSPKDTLTGRESSQDLSGTEVSYVTSSCAGS